MFYGLVLAVLLFFILIKKSDCDLWCTYLSRYVLIYRLRRRLRDGARSLKRGATCTWGRLLNLKPLPNENPGSAPGE